MDYNKIKNERTLVVKLLSRLKMKQNNLFFHAASSHDYRSWALHNLRLRTVCEGLVKNGDTLCYDPDYVQNICELHPIQLVKTVRMRTRQIAPLLDDPELNIKLIVLMRDPRAVRSSRNKLKWCSFDACNTLEVVLKYFYISRKSNNFQSLCGHYEEDLETAIHLSTSHPNNVLVVKYEELVTQPLDVIPIILKVSI